MKYLDQTDDIPKCECTYSSNAHLFAPFYFSLCIGLPHSHGNMFMHCRLVSYRYFIIYTEICRDLEQFIIKILCKKKALPNSNYMASKNYTFTF